MTARKAGPLARHYLKILRDEIRERIGDLTFYRELAVQWAHWTKKIGQPKASRSYVTIGEKLGEHILVLEARMLGIERLMDDEDTDAGWC